jgi:hypothetical protein
MGVPASEVGYTSATTGRGDYEVYKGHVVALGERYLAKRTKHGTQISPLPWYFMRFESKDFPVNFGLEHLASTQISLWAKCNKYWFVAPENLDFYLS